ncbi:MAG: hypothetical protein ACI9G1_002523 [Pirellulaceae bacterium]|jgi:hypothetical protein
MSDLLFFHFDQWARETLPLGDERLPTDTSLVVGARYPSGQRLVGHFQQLESITGIAAPHLAADFGKRLFDQVQQTSAGWVARANGAIDFLTQMAEQQDSNSADFLDRCEFPRFEVTRRELGHLQLVCTPAPAVWEIVDGFIQGTGQYFHQKLAVERDESNATVNVCFSDEAYYC